jgi:hypothetical protein
MPKTPLDSAIDTVQKIQQIHNKAEELRRNFDRVDPLKTATDVIGSIADRVNQLDAVLASTRRRTRRPLPKKQ